MTGRWGGRVSPHVADAKPMTPMTQRWRTIIRGNERYFDDPQHPANVKRDAIYNAPDAWARRRAASNPKNAGKLRFNATGQLLNKVSPEGELLD